MNCFPSGTGLCNFESEHTVDENIEVEDFLMKDHVVLFSEKAKLCKKGTDLLCGIDEAGRGALAGPLVVAGVILHHKIDGLDDSKKLSEAQREKLYVQIIENSDYEIVFTDNKTIDDIGLSRAIADSIERILEKLSPPLAIMDGNTNFGILGVQAVVKADEKVPEVSAASILAKVSRDRYMVELDAAYPEYGFKNHKGYGTKNHVNAIRENGRSGMHRHSFHIRELDD